jgi:hypothetical protein
VSLPASPSFREDGFSLIDGLDRLTRGWFLSNIDEARGEFVSQLDGFAVLTPDRKALAVGGNLSPDALAGILGQSGVQQALSQSIQDDTVELATLPGDEDIRLALVPIKEGEKISRVYAFTVDQTAAASLTNMALTVVTLTTSLLIVMGFSVPATIASRRIRER